MWEMEIKAADAPKFVESFMKMVSATKDVRSGHIAGMGLFQFGRGKSTHYIYHSFKSYSDLKKRLDAYMNNQGMGIYFTEIKNANHFMLPLQLELSSHGCQYCG